MSCWQSHYQDRDSVEVLYPFNAGKKWVRCFVAWKTMTGHPVVSIATTRGAMNVAVDRKSDIRFPIPQVSP